MVPWIYRVVSPSRRYNLLAEQTGRNGIRLAEIPAKQRIIQNTISKGNRTEWSPARSDIIRVIPKSDDHAAGVRFVYHEYDYTPNWTTQSLNIN